MQGEARRLLVDPVAARSSSARPTPLVDLASAAKRQAFVRSGADEVVAEREQPLLERDDEFAERVPARLVAGAVDLVTEDRAEQFEAETSARRPRRTGAASDRPESSVSIRIVSSVSTDSGSSSGAP